VLIICEPKILCQIVFDLGIVLPHVAELETKSKYQSNRILIPSIGSRLHFDCLSSRRSEISRRPANQPLPDSRVILMRALAAKSLEAMGTVANDSSGLLPVSYTISAISSQLRQLVDPFISTTT